MHDFSLYLFILSKLNNKLYQNKKRTPGWRDKKVDVMVRKKKKKRSVFITPMACSQLIASSVLLLSLLSKRASFVLLSIKTISLFFIYILRRGGLL